MQNVRIKKIHSTHPPLPSHDGTAPTTYQFDFNQNKMVQVQNSMKRYINQEQTITVNEERYNKFISKNRIQQKASISKKKSKNKVLEFQKANLVLNDHAIEAVHWVGFFLLRKKKKTKTQRVISTLLCISGSNKFLYFFANFILQREKCSDNTHTSRLRRKNNKKFQKKIVF